MRCCGKSKVQRWFVGVRQDEGTNGCHEELDLVNVKLKDAEEYLQFIKLRGECLVIEDSKK